MYRSLSLVSEITLLQLRYIYNNSGSIGLVVESPALLARLLLDDAELKSLSGPPKFIVSYLEAPSACALDSALAA